jgi:hypothetical protein
MTTTTLIATRPRLARAIEREEFVLCVGRKPALRIERDPIFGSMWRVRLPSGGVSDMLNVSRAKDLALDLAEGIEARKTPTKSPLKSLNNFSWSRWPAAQNGRDDLRHAEHAKNEPADAAP